MTPFPPINIGNMDIKLSFGNLILNILYIKFGYFYKTMPEHSHSIGSYELHYIPNGKGTLIADGERYPLETGSLFMTGPSIIHEQIPDHQDPMAEYCIFFEVLPGNRAPISQLSELLLSTPFWIGQDKENVLDLFYMLANELMRKSAGMHHMVTIILEMIVIRLVRQYPENHSVSKSVPIKVPDDLRLLSIENCFLYEYASISLKKLADQLGLSTRQTEREIQRQYGMCFKDKKLNVRMNTASRLLSNTNHSISEIAASVGFATLEQFCHAFKKYFGMSATKFRKSAQVQE